MKALRLVLLAFVLASLPRAAFALPQLAVLAARQCDNCHVQPEGWNDPALVERKCSLSCNACHLNPTGGGMRNAGGIYYYQEILPIVPLFGDRPSQRQVATRAGSSKNKKARKRLALPAQLTLEGLGAWAAVPVDPPGRVPASNTNFGDGVGAVLAAGPSSQPSSAPSTVGLVNGVDITQTPGVKERYGGINPRPWVQIGADFRALGYFPTAADQSVAFFPMQTDIYLAGTPYNPAGINQGRLTFLVNAGVLGRRTGDVSTIADRIFVREWYAMFYDLPFQMYAKAGQFLPAFGWRLEDHTSFIRQDNSFNNERQVTGVEIGINPNYPFAHLSFYVPGPAGNRDLSQSRNRLAVIDGSDGFGTALQAGWRDLGFQLAGSVLFETRDAGTEFMAGASWGVNIHEAEHPWMKLFSLMPLIYLGELDYRRLAPTGEQEIDSLSAFHEIDIVLLEGLFGQVRYDWIDPNLRLRDDERHRLTLGVQVFPITYMEVNLQGRINLEPNDRDNNEFLAQLHLFY